MSTILITDFTKYTQTMHEELAGSSYTLEQKQFIQTQIATAAESLLALVPDPNNYSAYVQTQAHYKGQIDALRYLLDCSVSSEAQLLTLATHS